MINVKILFWRSVPMDVSIGDFEQFAKNWKDKIYVISYQGYPKERQQCGFSLKGIGNATEIVLSESSNPMKVAKKIIDKNYNCIHLFSGIREHNQKILDYLIKKCKNLGASPLVGVFSERPNMFGNRVEKMLRLFGYNILYHYLAKRYNKFISAFLAMGGIGVDTYIRYGFSENIMFKYMYCPKLPQIDAKIKTAINEIKFLYVGRFNYVTKGLDILMNAFDKLEYDNWTLDIVGGYGDRKAEVINWCNTHDNVNFVGSWNNEEVCIKMRDYDVCVVPSRYDGWNLIPNQAIRSGIATIITEEAGSDELINASGAGLVVKPEVDSFYHALEKVTAYPQICEEWKARALKYRDKISEEAVGDYFTQIIQYAFLGNSRKPSCPW
ncbi:MAG: hypothetical protein DBX58_04675 [Clostridiales bacterium]|nr:MAG: hypothetical protein DBX58_04675 [Clostridiales bacterium]